MTSIYLARPGVQTASGRLATGLMLPFTERLPFRSPPLGRARGLDWRPVGSLTCAMATWKRARFAVRLEASSYPSRHGASISGQVIVHRVTGSQVEANLRAL
jgi:hypothetical protein